VSEENSLVTQEENQFVIVSNQNPMSAMQLALNNNVDLDKVGKMLEYQQKWDAMEARKAYTQAMAAFKKNPPKITKDKKVGYENRDGSATGYSHASLGNVTNTINTGLAKHGFSAGWATLQEGSSVTVTCTITHKLGHSENTSLVGLADTSGKKNPIQALGSTITYLERYTLLALTGLATHDQDDDGRGATPSTKYITKKQQDIIIDLIAATETELDGFLRYAKAESVETIPEQTYKTVLNALKLKEKKTHGSN